MFKLLKVNDMMRALKNLISMHILEYPVLHMGEIHTR
jgi:hypothetical protein